MNKKITDTLTEKTKTRPLEILEIKVNRSKQTFSLGISLQLKEARWIMGMTNLEVCTAIIIKTVGNFKIIVFSPVFSDDIIRRSRVEYLNATEKEKRAINNRAKDVSRHRSDNIIF